ncbi:hypothetical protein V9T40_011640 [Parthenolecanium corni]|uniref:Uncharacterized protein n=1 Tax=Parthenolecanium corni TaxID=536013 RepID=A0AAN9T9A3_9HEMI
MSSGEKKKIKNAIFGVCLQITIQYNEEHLHSNDHSELNEDMRCLICDTDVTHNSYNILYTVFESSGSLLSDNVNKVLKRDLDAVTTRSTVLCKRCYSLFGELDAAESKCAVIKNEIQSTYLKTCELYNDIHLLSVPGVACQTENVEQSTQLSEKQPDLKLKISLVSKRKRGRPVKSQQRKRGSSNNNIQDFSEISVQQETEKVRKTKDKSEKKETEVTSIVEEVVESRRTRSTTKTSAKKKSIPVPVVVEVETENIGKPEEFEVTIPSDVKLENIAEVEHETKKEDVQENGESFVPESVSYEPNDDNKNDDDDDDFEWKEEPFGDVQDDSTQSDDDRDEKSGDMNEEDWQSSSNTDGKKKQKRKKKRKRGDRKGERAFMVPIHECNQCGKKWRTVTELKSHIASHSDVRPFVCEICGQAYKMKKALDIHIGMHNGIHPFVCNYCNKSFTQKVGLEKHLPIHTGVTRFQCDLCGKRFIHQKSFNIHKMTHTGEKNIHCPICKLAVFSQSHLKRHYRVHTGERPYGCNICGKKFAEKYNLNAHARIHDPNSAGEGRRRCHTCPICGMTYDRKHKMADHLSSVHCMWQSPNLEFKSEDFYNMDVQQTVQNQHHLLPLQVQQTNAMQPQQGQVQQQPHSLQPQPASQPQQPQMSAPQPPPTQQPPPQMAPTHQAQQHHHIAHHPQQQHSPHHLQQHHAQSAVPSHHLLLTQHQIQQTLQTHISHHPAANTVTVAAVTPPPLQPISSVFQLVSVPSAAPDAAAAHHNRMNAVSASMPVPTLSNAKLKMTTKEAEELSVCSEETNSICDEERTRKLFQACDADGDGYIDSQDLALICRELNLDSCIEGLMHELGADEDGKISFDKFLTRKIALRPEIHALKKKHSSRDTNDYIPSSSNNSLGKHDCWEFDSGARDLSPEPSTLQRLIDSAGGGTNTGNLLQLANKLHLAALASLRAEISELNTRLQSVTEERDILETALKKCQEKSENSVIQRYEEQITELHSVIAELNKKLDNQKSRVIAEEEDGLSEGEYCVPSSFTNIDDGEKKPPEPTTRTDDDKKLKQLRLDCLNFKEVALKKEVELKHSRVLLNCAYEQIEKLKIKLRESENRRLELTNSPEVRRKTSFNSQLRSEISAPVMKVAERVRLPKMERSVTGSEIATLGVSHTEVAEHLVSGVQAECNIQELCRQDQKHLEIEAERLHSKLEHLKAQNNTLQISMHETREHCERMYILLGKYESNAIALKLSSDTSQEMIEKYESLVTLLSQQRSESAIVSEEEKNIRSKIAALKEEKNTVQSTVVELESYCSNPSEKVPKPNSCESKKLDLEMAVLMQDLMEIRESNAELRATVYMLDRERESLELKVAALQSQLQAFALVKSENQGEGNDKESRLQERLKEVAVTLEKVNKNADLRQKQSIELANQLKSTNCALMKTLERCKRKSQLRLRKLETEMITMMEKHAAQVRSLKQRIAFLEELNREKLSNIKLRENSVTVETTTDVSNTTKERQN